MKRERGREARQGCFQVSQVDINKMNTASSRLLVNDVSFVTRWSTWTHAQGLKGGGGGGAGHGRLMEDIIESNRR